MSRYHSYLNSAKEILSVYKGEEPLASFLKKYFAQHKKFGSKDRKQISHLCYCYFRMGKALTRLSVEERIMISLFLCSNETNKILEELKPTWNETVHLSLKEKSSMLNDPHLADAVGREFSIHNVFPWKDELSEGIDHEKFCESFFQQPDLFLRLRPGKEEIVKEKLQKANIDFKTISDSCIALDNATKIDSIIELDHEAVVQDYNSQQVCEFFKLVTKNQQQATKIWDCCAGSGGKSIMLYDLNPSIELTVSDVRESILANLKKRFSKGGIKSYRSYVLDLARNQKLSISNFDLIIADVPCTGSGTWGRTPEQLFYFTPENVIKYSSLQKQIVSNVIPHVKNGGYFLYSTCSVFKKENEEMIEFIKEIAQVELIKTEVLKGYDKKADTMFAALWRKPL